MAEAGSWNRVLAAVLSGLALAAPFILYPVFLMEALCFALFACAFNLLIGYVGLLSFGHAAFFGSAAYITAHTVKVWGVPPELGILAGAAVAPEGPAAAAGIQHGDRIVAIDGSQVRDLADFYRALWSRGAAGITVELTVNREGEQHEIGVKTSDRYRYLKLGTTY